MKTMLIVCFAVPTFIYTNGAYCSESTDALATLGSKTLIVIPENPAPLVKPESPPIPDRKKLEAFHLRLEHEFGEVAGNGLSRMVRIHVHQAQDDSLFTLIDGQDTWKIKSLDLVGLLANNPVIHETPVIKTAENSGPLPNGAPPVFGKFAAPAFPDAKLINHMARNAKVRDGDEFEKEALAKIMKGEKLVTEAGSDEIHMVGALTSTKDCLSCHANRSGAGSKPFKEGDVLGAFTYRIERVKTANIAR